ncbi:MAG: tyrosine-type recombinase/integrase [Candidatus Andersenbacteria bacterium]|nr:tyrosine-type recombinase/integrase [Candidatus Andersenbacteria bacterium]MBI3250657.1 tyrosine-type recombinase/integrase [Candidatus Andersenbacteria bacterium]
MSHNIKSLHSDFIEELEIGLGRSPKTVENYDRYLRAFFEHGKIAELADITQESVRSFRRHISQNGAALPTQNYYLIAIRQFLKYLIKRDIEVLSPEKIQLAKLPDRDIDVLYPEEVDMLLGAVIPDISRLQALRDKTLFNVLFSTGMRISEAIRLNRDDVRPHSNEMTVRGKGNKVRVVFLSEEALGQVHEYLERRTDTDPALFVRHRKNVGNEDDLRITPRTVQRLIKRYAAAAGITKDITPHTLRHSFATDLLSNGADVRQVQQLLGHSSITTTQVYTHFTDVQLRGVHERFHHKKKST